MAFSLEVLAKIEIDTSQLLIQKFSEEKKYISVPLMKSEVEQYSQMCQGTPPNEEYQRQLGKND